VNEAPEMRSKEEVWKALKRLYDIFELHYEAMQQGQQTVLASYLTCLTWVFKQDVGTGAEFQKMLDGGHEHQFTDPRRLGLPHGDPEKN
jgi:hypothetical protein